MRRVIFSSVVLPSLPYFSTLSHEKNCFRKTLLNTKYLFWLPRQVLSEKYLILRRNQRYIIIFVHRFSCKVTCYYSQNLVKIYFTDRRSKNTQVPNFMKIRPVGNGRTDSHDEANIRVYQFCERAVKMEETFHDFLQMQFFPLSAADALILVRSHVFLILNMTFDTLLFPYTSVYPFINSSWNNHSFDFFAYSRKWLPGSFPSVLRAVHWTDFREIWKLRHIKNLSRIYEWGWNWTKIWGNFTWRPK